MILYYFPLNFQTDVGGIVDKGGAGTDSPTSSGGPGGDSNVQYSTYSDTEQRVSLENIVWCHFYLL